MKIVPIMKILDD
jgi:hypothetical protein